MASSGRKNTPLRLCSALELQEPRRVRSLQAVRLCIPQCQKLRRETMSRTDLSWSGHGRLPWHCRQDDRVAVCVHRGHHSRAGPASQRETWLAVTGQEGQCSPGFDCSRSLRADGEQ
jgi:hypothetical protein